MTDSERSGPTVFMVDGDDRGARVRIAGDSFMPGQPRGLRVTEGDWHGTGLFVEAARWVLSLRDRPLAPDMHHKVHGPIGGRLLQSVRYDDKYGLLVFPQDSDRPQLSPRETDYELGRSNASHQLVFEPMHPEDLPVLWRIISQIMSTPAMLSHGEVVVEIGDDHGRSDSMLISGLTYGLVVGAVEAAVRACYGDDEYRIDCPLL